MSCVHPGFDSYSEVVQAVGTTRFIIHVSVNCSACGIPMQFIGLPVGTHLNGPGVSGDGTVARLAMADTPCAKKAPLLRVVNTDGGPT